MLEIVQGPSVTAWRHQIQAGEKTVAVYTRGSNGTNTTIYPLRDHLGSTEAVTNSSGTIVLKESFAAFGARRGSNWTGMPTGTEMTAIGDATRRGFTDHSMLDNLGLVHMNGRVFDPSAGRFVSADPNIDCSMDTQGWNRYSYVKNNPLTKTDPTGFFARSLLGASSFALPTNAIGVSEMHGFGTQTNTWDMEEVTVTGRRIRDDRMNPIDLMRFERFFESAEWEAEMQRMLQHGQEAIEAYQNCVESCRTALKDGLVDPLSSVAGGAADSGLTGALFGALNAAGNTASNAAVNGTQAAQDRSTDRRSTPAAQGRAGLGAAAGTIVSETIEGTVESATGDSNLSNAAGYLGDVAGGYLGGRIQSGSQVSRQQAHRSGVRGARNALMGRGVLVERALNAAGTAVATSACEAGCGN